MSEELNVKDSKFELKVTEWELDTIRQAINACRFPGTHIDLVSALQTKLKDKSKE